MPAYRFLQWQDEIGTVIGTSPTLSLSVDRDRTITAVYELVPEYTLTISSTIGGTTNPAPGAYPYVAGRVVTITAYPSAGYRFDHWELDGVTIGSANPINITMDTNHTLLAVFAEIPVGQGILDVHAFENSTEVQASVEVVGVETRTTPFTMALTIGTYTLKATYKEYSAQSKTVNITEGFTTSVDFQFKKAVIPPVPPITGPFGLWQFPVVNSVKQFITSFLERIRRR